MTVTGRQGVFVLVWGRMVEQADAAQRQRQGQDARCKMHDAKRKLTRATGVLNFYLLVWFGFAEELTVVGATRASSFGRSTETLAVIMYYQPDWAGR